MTKLGLAWRMTRRDFASGEVLVLVASLVLAVAAVTGVGFVTDRTARALAREANMLLGADAVLRDDAPIAPALRERAAVEGIAASASATFPSMLRAGDRFQLVEVRAVEAGYPLRGALEDGTAVAIPIGPPAPGEAWIGARLAQQWQLRAGDRVKLGSSELVVARIVTREPDAAFDYFDVAPRVFVNLADLPATGLVQEGSRIGYRLAVAGEPAAVARWVAAAKAGLGAGTRLETIEDARPELRRALARADRFLGLAALASAILAAIAIAMAARRHAARHLDSAAVLRCLGASARDLLVLTLAELGLLLAGASLAGIALAWLLQAGLAGWLSGMLGTELPAPSWRPAIEGFGVALVLLAGFALGPVLRIRRTPTLRVLRRELEPAEPRAALTLLAGLAALGGLLAWRANDATLAAAVLGAIAATAAVLACVAWLLLGALRGFAQRVPAGLRLGLVAATRRRAQSIAQVVALGLGLMALTLLTLVRTDLLSRWREETLRDVPDRFLVNVQPDQVERMKALLVGAGVAAPELHPMIRGRLADVNGVRPRDARREEGRPSRLAEREFNLSAASALREDNTIVAGAFPSAVPSWSVEARFAATLGWKLGDRLAFDVAGRRVEAPIGSLRTVEWESFRPNFFVLGPPELLVGLPASYIGSFRAPAQGDAALARLVGEFPNVSVIDVGRIVQQITRIAEQVSRAVEYVFVFTLAAGVLVLLASVLASQDERLREAAVLRAIGARRRQLVVAQLAEFGTLGLVSGVIGAGAAAAVSLVLATQVFEMPARLDWLVVSGALALGVTLVVAFGSVATRRVLRAPPAESLRTLAG
ncbi:MAG TPA: FtsX-like permease family protein [Candidatus Saccharimonadia bacterium]|nr:FtsX-like permease family protein [Candidatus Saccharimonadia bacterium]